MGSKTIFVVEDDEFIRTDLAEILESEGYDVKSFRNGKEALDEMKFITTDPDLIILDLMMPVMDGYVFLSEIAKIRDLQVTDILVLSADRDAANKLPMDQIRGYVRKPIDLDLFLSTVDRLTH